MACKASNVVNFNDNHMLIMTSYQAWMTSHFKTSAILDPPSWISKLLQKYQNGSRIDLKKSEQNLSKFENLTKTDIIFQWNAVWKLASYADALWAPSPRGGGRLRDEPKERLRRRLFENMVAIETKNHVTNQLTLQNALW